MEGETPSADILTMVKTYKDEKGIYAICDKCGEKAYYQYYNENSWSCECACGELLDED